MRDVFMLQAVLEERTDYPVDTSCRDGREDENQGGSALLLVQFFNRGMPARFCKSTAELVMEMDRHRRMTKRQLLKAAHRAWALVGEPKPRGWTTYPYAETLRRLERLLPFIRELQQRAKAGETLSNEEITAGLGDILAVGR